MKINGLKIKVIRKKIKNVHLYVKPPFGNIVVTCPINYPDESIKLFILTKLPWIRRQVESFKNQPRQSKREFVSGETVYLLGKKYFLQVNYDNKKYSINIIGHKINFIVRNGSTSKQREVIFNNWYRKILKEQLDILIPKIEEKTGLKCSKYTITNMQTKWGSCNIKTQRINLNLQLAKVPILGIEYVVLHELAHTIEKTHNHKFKSILDKFMPTWREIKKLLNSQNISHYYKTKV